MIIIGNLLPSGSLYLCDMLSTGQPFISLQITCYPSLLKLSHKKSKDFFAKNLPYRIDTCVPRGYRKLLLIVLNTFMILSEIIKIRK